MAWDGQTHMRANSPKRFVVRSPAARVCGNPRERGGMLGIGTGIGIGIGIGIGKGWDG
jgi:hypothetical protein